MRHLSHTRRSSATEHNVAQHPTHQGRWITHPLLWLAVAACPATAAAECTQDSDCAPNERCEISGAMSTTACYIDESGEEVCEESSEEAVSFCVELPIPCEMDSDCPSHLRCGEGPQPVTPIATDSAESGSSGGAPGMAGSDDEASDEDPGAERMAPPPEEIEPTPEPAEMMCVFVATGCEADSDCAENFHCEINTYVVDCAQPPVFCDEEGDCPEPEPVDCGEEEEITEGFCEPDEIECDDSNACPSDWSCRQVSEWICDGEDIEDIAVDEPAPEPEEASDPMPAPPEGEEGDALIPEEDPCEELVRSICVPAGFGPQGGGQSAETGLIEPADDDTTPSGNGSEPGEPRTESEEEPTNSEDDTGSANADIEEGGCDARGGHARAWMLLGLLGFLGLRRRRETAA